jgi:hypothetical protein
MTLKELNRKYPEYHFYRDSQMGSKYPYAVLHKPTGYKSSCLISRVGGLELMTKEQLRNNPSHWRKD